MVISLFLPGFDGSLTHVDDSDVSARNHQLDEADHRFHQGKGSADVEDEVEQSHTEN